MTVSSLTRTHSPSSPVPVRPVILRGWPSTPTSLSRGKMSTGVFFWVMTSSSLATTSPAKGLTVMVIVATAHLGLSSQTLYTHLSSP